ncbi:uncharacterized protein BP01DRAFT_375685 [Aspergillus saccharolyticus JOP 1030-1]|uniref:Uncharacterized protein n=1 Tax=Aspergillus saccharolyticus JOP 1030-1 TaxID=1450539 RepID=A0A318ZSM4_9EURO|nr:hypothetical protein BP01DRAFT_375685 [Aspergillus saccharolyticus JOP 1030-1]PYH43068.1 hypothetical protein BP01DRAFT_375685 [Aspergillus saccharolyticus JOP 1030-1]
MSYTSSSFLFTKSTPPPVRPQRRSPFATKSSLHLHLCLVSGEKYEQESSAKQPDLRRCLGHARIHDKSMELVKRDIHVHIRSMGSDSDDDLDNDLPIPRRSRRASKASAAPTPMKPAAVKPTVVKKAPSIKWAPEPVEKKSLLDKGRRCMEKIFSRRNGNAHWSQSGVPVVAC